MGHLALGLTVASNVFGIKRFIENMQIFCRILFTLYIVILDYKEKQFLGKCHDDIIHSVVAKLCNHNRSAETFQQFLSNLELKPPENPCKSTWYIYSIYSFIFYL